MASKVSQVPSMTPYQQVKHEFQLSYDWQITTGSARPIVLPQDILGFLIFISWVYAGPYHFRLPSGTKFFVYGIIASICMQTIWCKSSLGLAYGTGWGLCAFMNMLISLNFIVLHDPRTFERRRVETKKSEDGTELNTAVWEGMPRDHIARFYWTIDLMFSCLGTNWKFQSKTSNEKKPIETISKQRPGNWKLLSSQIGYFSLSYLVIDAIKVVMLSDPYFLAQDHGVPAVFPYLHRSMLLLTIDRYILTAIAVFAALSLVQNTIHLVHLLLLLAFFPADTAQLYYLDSYPQLYGSLTWVFSHGLVGFWSKFWHQIVRLHFAAPADALIDGLGIPQGTITAKALRSVVVFALSGCLHAAGSLAGFGSSKPFLMFLFFAIQPAGIALEMMLSKGCQTVLPLSVRQAGNGILGKVARTVFTAVWLLTMFGWVADDFASAGLWLFEPLPVSFFRGLGVGSDGQYWWCWGGEPWFHLHRGDHWMDVGVAA